MATLNKVRYREIIELAEGVCEDFPSYAHTDLRKIIDENSITVSFGNYGDSFDGMLEYEEGEFHIYCNLERVIYHENTRARFTLGHELGHYYIDEHRNSLMSGKVGRHGSVCEQFSSGSQAELEADIFASNLLMPPSKFIPKLQKLGRGADAVCSLSSYFKSSITSTSIQYSKWVKYPCIIVKWGFEELEWKNGSPLARALGFTRIRENLEHLANESSTAVMISKGGKESDGFSFERTTTVISAWCSHVNPGSANDIIMIEDAINLGRHGVITLLYPHEYEITKVDHLHQQIVNDDYYVF